MVHACISLCSDVAIENSNILFKAECIWETYVKYNYDTSMNDSEIIGNAAAAAAAVATAHITWAKGSQRLIWFNRLGINL